MNRSVACLVVAFLLMALLVGGVVIYQLLSEGRQRAALYEVAGQLGYHPEAELAQASRCWDIYAHCGLFLYHTTALSRDQFGQAVARLDLDPIRSADIDGYSIFTGINLGTAHRLTANGNDGLEFRAALPEPQAYEWHLSDRHGRRWVIAYFAVFDSGVQYSIDGRPLHDNIVSILLQTR